MEFHILRIGELGREMARHSAFPIYIFRDVYSHYGYPIPIFYGCIFLYPAAFLHMIGLSALSAYKITVIFVLMFAFLSAYGCLKIYTQDYQLAFLGAFLYTISPFFLNELFVRASLGAALVYVFIPIVLLGYIQIVTDRKRLLGIFALGGGMAGVISSHVISTVLIVIALFIMFLTGLRHINNIWRAIKLIFLSVIVCLMLTAWYLLPMAEQFAVGTYKAPTANTLWITTENPISMLIPMHLFMVIKPLFHLSIPVSEIGGAVVPMIIITLYLVITGKIRDINRTERTLLILYYVLTICLFIPFIWNWLDRVLSFMQFSWRIFLIISVIGVIFLILMLRDDGNGYLTRIELVVSIFSAVYILIFFFGYFGIRTFVPGLAERVIGHNIPEYTYVSETTDNLYIPVEMDEKTLSDRPREVYTDEVGQTVSYTYTVNEDAGSVIIDIESNAAESEVVFTCPFIMYKGYTARSAKNSIADDTDTYDVSGSADGFVNVTVPAGTTGRIEVAYTGTILQRISFVISVASLVLFVVFAMIYFGRLRISS